MKIAFFHELSYGGARRVVEEYGKILKEDYQTDLYYVDEIEDKKIRKIFSKVFYYQFLPEKWTGRDWKTRLYKDTRELYKLYKLHQKIAEEIGSKNYDFVFAHPSKFTQAPFILRILKTKKIYFCQEPLRIVYDKNLKIFKDLSFTKRVYELLNRLVRKRIDAASIKHADIILANSEFSRRWIKKSYNINSRVCYLGVDIDQFKPLEIKKEYDILFLGNKDWIEGYDLLLEAVRLFKKKPVVKVIERNNIGMGISDNELVGAYNKAKVVVALSRNEPFGLIPIESMACGVPVVAVSEGGFKESVIDGKTGFLIKRSPKDLHLALSKLLKNDSLRKQLGTNGRKHVTQSWTWEKSVKLFLKIIDIV